MLAESRIPRKYKTKTDPVLIILKKGYIDIRLGHLNRNG